MQVRRGRELTQDLTLTADVAIVGSGAGGGMAARELARAGARVIVLEEGPFLRAEEMSQREEDMMPKLFQERGGQMTSDLAIRVMSGRALGGSTVHNINLCKRIAPEILALWEREHSVTGMREADLRPTFEQVEADLSVRSIEEKDRNANNQILARGLTALGWRGGALSHNRVGCQGSGFCEIGCPFNAKQNALKVLLPEAASRGAQIFSDVRALAVKHEGGRVRGIEAEALDAGGRGHKTLRIRAAAVVLAGSAIGSAALALKSGLPDPYLQLGRGLRMHPGLAVAGWFDDKVDGFRGIPQSYECTEWLDLSPGSQRRVWITTAFAHPIGAAVMLPGFGAFHRTWMQRYSHLAVLMAMVHDQSSGRVGLRGDGRAKIDYTVDAGDRAQLLLGVRACARILLAGGAKKVLIPSIPPIEVETEAQIDAISEEAVAPHSIALTAVHPMGTLRMGDNPRTSVVSSQGAHHQLAGLFVLDGSLFPTSIGGPPQIPIYALSMHLSPGVADFLRKSSS